MPAVATLPTVSTSSSQLGVEASLGAGVEAPRRLQTCAFDLTDQGTYDIFTPAGLKYPTSSVLDMDWSAGTLSGRISYDEILYLLAGAVQVPSYTPTGEGIVGTTVTGTPTIATVLNVASTTGFPSGNGTFVATPSLGGPVVFSYTGTTGTSFTGVSPSVVAAGLTSPNPVVWDPTATWAFDSSETENDSPVTYSMEQGSNILANRITGAMITDLEMVITRNGQATVQGTVLGQLFNQNINDSDNPRTAVTSVLPGVVSYPGQWNVYADPTAADLGTTQLEDVIIADFKIGTRWAAFWALRTDQASWTTFVESVPAVDLTLTMAADSVGWGYLANARVGEKVFVRLQGTGPALLGNDSGDHYKMTMDLCGEVMAAPNKSNQQNALTLAWQFTSIYDETWAKSYHIAVQNQVAPNLFNHDIVLA